MAEIIGVVGVVVAGQRHDSRMVEIVIPQSIQPVPLFLNRPHELRMLPLVFRDDDDLPPLRRRAGLLADNGQYMFW